MVNGDSHQISHGNHHNHRPNPLEDGCIRICQEANAAPGLAGGATAAMVSNWYLVGLEVPIVPIVPIIKCYMLQD